MPFVLKTITMEERIAAAIPDGRYDEYVESILRDEASDWKYKVLAGDETIFDTEVSKIRANLKDAEAAQVASYALVDKLTKNLKAKESEKRSTNKLQVAKDLITISGMKTSITSTLEDVVANKEAVSLLKRELKKWEGLQEVTRLQFRSLRNVVSQYKENKDREFLRRGVHCVCSIASEMSAKY
jgi:hypothetical protein